MEGHTSRTLLEQVRSQDQEAWGRLLYLYSPLVYHWCHQSGVHGADADDVRQEVFQTVAISLAAFRRDRPTDTFRGWLRVITQRRLIDHHRRQQRQPLASGGTDVLNILHQVPDSSELPIDEPSEEVKRLHQRALELIRSDFEDSSWQAFWRCAVEGQLPADVAQDMGMTPAAVRKAKSRVLRRLKEELGELLE